MSVEEQESFHSSLDYGILVNLELGLNVFLHYDHKKTLIGPINDLKSKFTHYQNIKTRYGRNRIKFRIL
jgi:hypothetical protein